MSKASEWAALNGSMFLEDEDGDTIARAVVDEDGVLEVELGDGPHITPAAALKLARWILDTFGDSTGTPEPAAEPKGA